jgi:hypothetical protein
VLILSKRLASAIVCLALACGVIPVRPRGDLSPSRAQDALTFDRPFSTVGQFGTARSASRLFASGRSRATHEVQPCTAGARRGLSDAACWTRLLQRISVVAASVAICARPERGPPAILS